MKFAVLSEDGRFVDNVIVAEAAQQEELEAALGRTLLDAGPLGMETGDYYNGAQWTRNVDGEQVPLPVGDHPAVEEALRLLEGEKRMWMSEAQRAKLLALREAMDAAVAEASESAEKMNGVAALARPWKPGAYEAGDVRRHGDIPYRCVQAHESTENPDWTPDAAPALWMQYHGTSRETARPWVQPTGAHDMYRAGEWMVWTDGKAYRCLSDTAYSPAEYGRAWEAEG